MGIWCEGQRDLQLRAYCEKLKYENEICESTMMNIRCQKIYRTNQNVLRKAHSKREIEGMWIKWITVCKVNLKMDNTHSNEKNSVKCWAERKLLNMFKDKCDGMDHIISALNFRFQSRTWYSRRKWQQQQQQRRRWGKMLQPKRVHSQHGMASLFFLVYINF